MKTALQTFGSVGYPLGFRDCMLGSLFKEGIYFYDYKFYMYYFYYILENVAVGSIRKISN